MKKLTTLLMVVCVIALACSNDVVKPAQTSLKQSDPRIRMSIGEEGGTPDRTEAAITEFLKIAQFQGQYSTFSGESGFKVKDGEIYEVIGNLKTEWVKLEKANIAVNKDLKKLQIEELNGTVTKIYTFDDLGYYVYDNGEDDIPTYYIKYDFVEKYAGRWSFPHGSIVITDSTVLFTYRSGQGWVTEYSQLKGNILKLKGSAWTSSGIRFSADGKTATLFNTVTGVEVVE